MVKGNKRARLGLSLLLTFVLVLGTFTPFVFADNDQTKETITIFSTDFEENDGGFTTGVTEEGMENCWEWGVQYDDPKPLTGTKVWATGLEFENYDPDCSCYIESPQIELKNVTTATLSFNHWYETPDEYDYGIVQISDDNGETWENITNKIYGDSGDAKDVWKWVEEKVDITDYIGKTIKIRFFFYSEGGYYKGWYINDVSVTGEKSTEEEPPAKPAAPTNLVAAVTDEGIKLTWEVSEGSTYKVYRSETSGRGYTEVGSSTTNEYIDETVKSGKNYYYVVTAVGTSGNESEHSNEVSATVKEENVIFSTDFEENDGGFKSKITKEGFDFKNCWEWGKPTSGPKSAFTGTNVWATNLSGKYGSNSRCYIESPEITIPADVTATLFFDHWIDTETGYHGNILDYGRVQVSEDGGKDWVNVADDRIGGHIRTWESKEVDLTVYSGKTIKIGFFFDSNGVENKNFDGWYIDNVKVVANTGETQEPPVAPTGLAAEALDEGIKLTWNNSSESDLYGYKVYRSDIVGEGYSFIAEPVTNEYMDKDVVIGKTYYYRVKAVDSFGNESEYSNEALATAKEEGQDAETIIFSTDFEKNDGGFHGSEDWEWGEPTSGPGKALTGKNVWATKLSGNYNKGMIAVLHSPLIKIPESVDTTLIFDHWIHTSKINENNYCKVLILADNKWTPVTGPMGGSIKEWENRKISLKNYKGKEIQLRFYSRSDYSETFPGWYIDNVKIVADDGGIQEPQEPPAAPAGLSAEIVAKGINLTWVASETEGLTYNVYRSNVPGGEYTLIGNLFKNEYIDTEIKDGKTYYYVITAVDNSLNESKYSEEVSVNIAKEPPAAPTGLSAVATNEGIKLMWISSSESDLSGYKVYRSEVSGSGYKCIEETTTNEYTDTAVEGGKTYYYLVTAVDTLGNPSEYSEEEFATAEDKQQGETVIYSTDFEKNNGGFATGVTEEGMENYWEWGIPYNRLGPDAFTGVKVWTTGLDEDFGSDSRGYIQSPDIAIPENITAANLSFNHWMFASYFDDDLENHGNVQVSDDGGKTWTDISGKIGGDRSEWKKKEINLTDYIGKTINLRFFFYSVDDAFGFPGWYINNVSVTGVKHAAGDTKPAAPTNLVAAVTDEGIKLTWEVSEGLTYKIYRSENSGEGYTKIGSSTTNAYIDETVEGGKTYYYVITAVDTSGNESEYSEEVQATAVWNSIENLPPKTVIIGEEAFDIRYVNKNAEVQRKLINRYNQRKEIYIKLDNDRMVNIKGIIQDLEVLPNRLNYYDINGNNTVYIKPSK